MAPPSTATDTVFGCHSDRTAILFLIENSSYMAPLWQHLRDSYLPYILAAIEGANPSASVSPLPPLSLSYLPSQLPFRLRRCGCSPRNASHSNPRSTLLLTRPQGWTRSPPSTSAHTAKIQFPPPMSLTRLRYVKPVSATYDLTPDFPPGNVSRFLP